MSSPASIPSVFDINNLTALKSAVKKDDPQALKSAAQQFEALFMQMVLKSMRDATPREGMFDSDQTRMYESLLDQQLAQVMSAKGSIGLAALIEKQMSRASVDPQSYPDGLPLQPAPTSIRLDGTRPPLPLQRPDAAPQLLPLDRIPVRPGSGATSSPVAPLSGDAAGSGAQIPPAARDFVANVWPHAVEASRATGIPAHFLVAHAALETGWGRSEPRSADGRQSYNLFGIKAGRSWSGQTVDAATTEYVDGAPERRVDRFRAYGSYAEAFRDYVALMQSNPRFAGVLGARDATTFARSLQQSGYATDPAYAAKLERLIGGPTLRVALSA